MCDKRRLQLEVVTPDATSADMKDQSIGIIITTNASLIVEDINLQ